MYNPYDKDTQQKIGLIFFIFVLILTIAFVIAKLAAVITFGWLWVFAPIWLPTGLGILMGILGIKPPGA
jgi:hypothetical protein